MKLKPTNDRLLILRDEQEKVSPGGIILPKDEIPTGTGIVMAIGPKVHDVEVGNRVIFKKLDGHDFKIDGKDHVVLREFNIQGVFND